MTGKSQRIYFRMDGGYKATPDSAVDTSPNPSRIHLALEDYTQKLVGHVTKFATDNGYPEGSVIYVDRRINMIGISAPEALVKQILSLDENGRKAVFPNASAVISHEDMNKPSFNIR